MANPCLVRATFHALSGLAADDATISLAFSNSTSSPVGADAATALVTLLNTSWVYHMPLEYLSPDRMVANGLTVEAFDLTGHLDGSPHGSHTYAATSALPDNTAHGPLPDMASITVSYHPSLAGVAEIGPTATLPSTESAQDQGAPATHTGITRPASRRRGRFYLGPLNDLALDWTGPGNRPVIHAHAIADLTDFVGGLKVSGFGWAVWSRRDAAMHNVANGWIDNRFTSVRRREEDKPLRSVW